MYTGKTGYKRCFIKDHINTLIKKMSFYLEGNIFNVLDLEAVHLQVITTGDHYWSKKMLTHR